jgi:hypothetical protein
MHRSMGSLGTVTLAPNLKIPVGYSKSVILIQSHSLREIYLFCKYISTYCFVGCHNLCHPLYGDEELPHIFGLSDTSLIQVRESQ